LYVFVFFVFLGKNSYLASLYLNADLRSRG